MKKNSKASLLRLLGLFLVVVFYLSGQVSAEGSNNTSKYKDQTLCDVGDDVQFSCTTHTGKNLSVCGARQQNPYIPYMVYGTPGDISLTSPRNEKFPLKYTLLSGELPKEMGDIYRFNGNGRQYIIYSVYEEPDAEGHGLIIREISNHKIISRDFCVENVKYKENEGGGERMNSYLDRENKDKSHVDDIRRIISESVEDGMHRNLYGEE